MIRNLTLAVLATCTGSLVLSASDARAQLITAPGFQAEVVTSSIAGIGIAVAPNSFGAFSGHVFIADQGIPGSGNPNDGIVIRVNPSTGVTSTFASTPGNPAHLTFAPGGGFGTDLYVSTNQDPLAPNSGIVWRVDNAGNATRFGTQDPDGTSGGNDPFLFGGGDIAFSLAGPFGEHLYAGVSAGFSGDAITRLTSAGGTAALFHNFGPLDGNPSGRAFGTGVAGFSQDLYVGINVSGAASVESGVYILDSAAQRTELVVASSPNANGLITGLVEIEFAPGGVFGNSLYAADLAGRILRIDSSGNTSEFASGLSTAFGVAFGDANTLYVMGDDTLFAITPVPEPSTFTVMITGIIVIAGRGWQRKIAAHKSQA